MINSSITELMTALPALRQANADLFGMIEERLASPVDARVGLEAHRTF